MVCCAGFLVTSAKGVSQIELPGVPLGSFFGINYDEVSLPLETGDVFVFCSDGVTEAMTADSEEFTSERLIDVIKATRQATAREIVQAIVQAVSAHRAGAPPNDDMTVVVLKVTD